LAEFASASVARHDFQRNRLPIVKCTTAEFKQFTGTSLRERRSIFRHLPASFQKAVCSGSRPLKQRNAGPDQVEVRWCVKSAEIVQREQAASGTLLSQRVQLFLKFKF
jgi:hypothetical protein